VSAASAADVVIWNPWVAKSAAMADFGDDEWTGMLCVETGNVLAAVTLAPGQSHTMTATLEVTRRG
jgi:glucose-6-phosphate 1-epimerase